MKNTATAQALSASVDVRDACFDEVYEIAKNDDRIILLTDDQGAFSLNKFKTDFPDRYINIGIAEQNLVATAAGLALEGRLPVIYGISTFMSMRCHEQLRATIDLMDLPISVVSSGPGFTYASDGPTHHSLCDFALMNTMPNFHVYNPCDATSTRAAIRLSYERKKPSYVRLEKGVIPDHTSGNESDLKAGMQLVKEGKDVLLITSGTILNSVLKVSAKLSNPCDAAVLHIFQMKPLNTEILRRHMIKYKNIAVIEDSAVTGGLGGVIRDFAMERFNPPPRVLKIAPRDVHYLVYGDRDWMHKQAGIDTDTSFDMITRWLNLETKKVR